MTLWRDDLPTRWARIVRRHRDRAAILFDETDVLTYGQLDALSNQAARHMQRRGLRRGDRVCLHLEKGPAAYAAVLASIKLGVAYFAADPASPEPRLERIFEQCSPALIFTSTPEKLGSRREISVVCGGGSADFCANESAASLEPVDPPRLSDPAYIMFTSGSTGSPKGAVITHSNLRHFVEWALAEYSFTPEDRHTHLNPIYFDNSVFDMYSTLFSGGALVPFTSAMLQDPHGIVERIERLRCTVYFSVPSLLIFLQTTLAVGEGSMPTLRKVIFGGEGYPKTKLAELYRMVGRRARLVNVYGPTECTCICSTYDLTDADFEDLNGYPPIGELISTFSHHLLDGDEAVAPGEVGELCLGGPCVGHGYFNQPDLTRKAFVQNPLNSAYEERLYRTGDLMRRDSRDGKLWFVGRKDFQVKHQGYRIELEEIQHAVARVPGVQEAAVLQVFERGVSALVCFVAGDVEPDGVRRQAADLLPKYMVPSKVFVTERLPKSPNGKTDRKALAALYEANRAPTRNI